MGTSTFSNPTDANAYQQILQQFAKLADEFYKKKQWGKIEVVFRQGVPMTVTSTINEQVRGPEQAAVIKGDKPYAKEYR
jgi:hypothetical protein